MPLPISVALGAIPWPLILRTTPQIVGEARKLYEVVSKSRSTAKSSPRVQIDDLPEVSESLNELRLRIEEMEAHDAKQAELISQMAAQAEALSRGLQTVSSRTAVLLWIATGATLVAVIALVIAVLK